MFLFLNSPAFAADLCITPDVIEGFVRAKLVFSGHEAARLLTGVSGFPVRDAPKNSDEEDEQRKASAIYYDRQLWNHCMPAECTIHARGLAFSIVFVELAVFSSQRGIEAEGCFEIHDII